MILNLAIAWCLLSVPFSIAVGLCIRQGLHGDARVRVPHRAPEAPVSRQAAELQPLPQLPTQRRPVREASLQDS